MALPLDEAKTVQQKTNNRLKSSVRIAKKYLHNKRQESNNVSFTKIEHEIFNKTTKQTNTKHIEKIRVIIKYMQNEIKITNCHLNQYCLEIN